MERIRLISRDIQLSLSTVLISSQYSDSTAALLQLNACKNPRGFLRGLLPTSSSAGHALTASVPSQGADQSDPVLAQNKTSFQMLSNPTALEHYSSDKRHVTSYHTSACRCT